MGACINILWSALYVVNENVYADVFRSMLKPKYSEEGKPERQVEEAAFIHFMDFLDCCEGRYISAN